MPPSWNPERVLDVYPQDRPFHCVGTTLEGARCKNSFIRSAYLDVAQDLLDRLPELRECRNNREDLLIKLEDIAWYTLCPRWHQSKKPQAYDVAQRWLRIILDLDPRQYPEHNTPSRSSDSWSTYSSSNTLGRSSSSGFSSSGYSSDGYSDGPGYSMFRRGTSSATHSSRESGFSSSSGRTWGRSPDRASNYSSNTYSARSSTPQSSSSYNESYYSVPRTGTGSSSGTLHRSTSSRNSGASSSSEQTWRGTERQPSNSSSASYNSSSRDSGASSSSGQTWRGTERQASNASRASNSSSSRRSSFNVSSEQTLRGSTQRARNPSSASHNSPSQHSGVSSSSGHTLRGNTQQANNTSSGAYNSSSRDGFAHSSRHISTGDSSAADLPYASPNPISRSSGISSSSGSRVVEGSVSQASGSSTGLYNSSSRDINIGASNGLHTSVGSTVQSDNTPSLSPLARTRQHWDDLRIATGATQSTTSSQTSLTTQPLHPVRPTQPLPRVHPMQPVVPTLAPTIPLPPPLQQGRSASHQVQRAPRSSSSGSESTTTLDSTPTIQPTSHRTSILTGVAVHDEDNLLQNPPPTQVQSQNGIPSSIGASPSQPRARRRVSSGRTSFTTPDSTHTIQIHLNITVSGQGIISGSVNGDPQTPTPASRHYRSSTSTSSGHTVRSETYSASRDPSFSCRSPVVDSTADTVNEIIEAIESVVARLNSRSAASSPSTMGGRTHDSVHTPTSRTSSTDSPAGSPFVIYTPSSSEASLASASGQNTPRSPFESPVIVNTSPSSGSSSPVIVSSQEAPSLSHVTEPLGLLPGEIPVPGWRFNLASHPN